MASILLTLAARVNAGANMNKQFKILCGAAALVVAGQVSAATSWTLNTGSVAGNNSAVTASATGWANTGAGASADVQALQGQPAGTNLALYSGYGLGINNLNGCGSGLTCDVGDLSNNVPEHAIDNNQRYEMVLLSFAQSVKLTNAKFGWTGKSNYSGGDSDYTVMAYTGAAGGQGLVGKTWASLAAVGSGWTSIGNYADALTGANNSINAPVDPTKAVFSSYWLVGAYNPLAGGTSTNTNINTGNDYVKLQSVTGCVSGSTGCTPPGKVPEPGSLALFGLALLGMLTFRKHQKI
jgi:hypothetical protein